MKAFKCMACEGEHMVYDDLFDYYDAPYQPVCPGCIQRFVPDIEDWVIPYTIMIHHATGADLGTIRYERYLSKERMLPAWEP